MAFEKSCGAVVFTRVGGELRYVLAQSLRGHYGFPKGHVEPGETETETALRKQGLHMMVCDRVGACCMRQAGWHRRRSIL